MGRSIGARMYTNKPPNPTRIFFVYVNGLQFGSLGGEFTDLCFQMNEANIDVLSIAETKLDTQKRIVVATCAHAARRILSFSRILLSSSAITYNSHFKPVGTALLTAGSITGRITTLTEDPMGRWCATSYRGACTRVITVISAYQMCNAPQDRDPRRQHTTSRSMSEVTRQQAMINVSDPSLSRHPRTQFRLDLLAFIQALQREVHDVILTGDFNEPYGSDPSGTVHIAASCSLVDVLRRRIGSSNFAICCGGVPASITC
jgi:hypothetical protein